MMDAAELVNQSVIHKNFGKGTICSVDGDKYLSVKFEEKGKVCKFAYPQSFYRYLTLEDDTMQSDMDQIVEIWKQEKGIAEKEKLYHQYEKTLRSIEKRRIAAEEKKQKASQRANGYRRSC